MNITEGKALYSRDKAQHILLVEDNMGDVLLFKEIYKQRSMACTLDVVMDGESAINYLGQHKEFKEKATPDLVLLDINLPKFNGLQVLENIMQLKNRQDIPIIMLTGASLDQEIAKAKKLGANGFLVKGLDIKFHDLITISLAVKHDPETWVQVGT